MTEFPMPELPDSPLRRGNEVVFSAGHMVAHAAEARWPLEAEIKRLMGERNQLASQGAEMFNALATSPAPELTKRPLAERVKLVEDFEYAVLACASTGTCAARERVKATSNALVTALADPRGSQDEGGADTHAFKNFHRLLCERFGYTHDEKDWRRDQVSLIEHIAKVAASPSAARQAVAEPITTAARDVLAERRRQIEAEGWTPEHDDEHGKGEIARAAACYASPTKVTTFSRDEGEVVSFPPPAGWPWGSASWKPRDHRSNLVRAGALILAEIERLDRATQTGGDHA